MLRPGPEVEAAVDETGALAARGPYTICRYLAAPDRDREAFTAEGFYRSGNLVRARRYEGSLSYSSEGRVNDLIDRGGEKVNVVSHFLALVPGDGAEQLAGRCGDGLSHGGLDILGAAARGQVQQQDVAGGPLY